MPNVTIPDFQALSEVQLLIAVKELAARGASWTPQDRETNRVLAQEMRRRWNKAEAKS